VKHPNGVVLAGGRSTRMRGEKAFLRLDGTSGRTLLSRQVELLAGLGLHRLVLSARRDMPSTPPGLTVVRDEKEGLGPLAGILAAAGLDPERPLVVLAVDMPRVDEALLSGLITLARDAGGGAAPRVDGRWEPLCAVYPPGIAADIERMTGGRWELDGSSAPPAAAGRSRRSPSKLLDRLHAVGRVLPVPLDGAAARRLASWNHPRDLPAAVRAANPRTRCNPGSVTGPGGPRKPPGRRGRIRSSS
jgi:molybdopterin-guanine dinucleotide biosynthesis protein A